MHSFKVTNRIVFLFISVFGLSTVFYFYVDKDMLAFSASFENTAISSKTDDVVSCNFPKLDPFNPTAMKYYEKHPTIKCPQNLITITTYDGERVYVNATLKRQKFKNRQIQCWYRNVTYRRRVDFVNGEWQGPFEEYIDVQGAPEFVEVKCLGKGNNVVSKMHHYITRENIRNRMKVKPKRDSFADEQMNVLLLGLDSLSSQLFKRAMPKTRTFLIEGMNSIELNKYNKVADNTFPNLLALASGKYKRDLLGWTPMQGFDNIDFLWKLYKGAGYRTQYLSDRVDFDDFGKPPTDSYNLPMVSALMVDKVAFDNSCFQDKIEVKLWLDLIIEFAKQSIFSTGRFFSLAMIKRPTHDFPNQASAVDEHYVQFLREMNQSSLLNNTFLVFFGDHGPRTSEYRRTFSGSIEERTANMVIYAPSWFREKYSQLYQNLETNSERLTTNFDVHETIKDLLNFGIKKSPFSSKSEDTNRGISLFKEIPSKRTCKDADLAPHYCMCYGGGIVRKPPYILQEVGQKAVDDINALLSPRKSSCSKLTLRSVNTLVMLGGKVGWSAMYRVMFTTDPGGAEFEATVDYSIKFFVFKSIKTVGFISRINMYRGQSDCVQSDKLLRMYCYCVDLLDDQGKTSIRYESNSSQNSTL